MWIGKSVDCEIKDHIGVGFGVSIVHSTCNEEYTKARSKNLEQIQDKHTCDAIVACCKLFLRSMRSIALPLASARAFSKLAGLDC